MKRRFSLSLILLSIIFSVFNVYGSDKPSLLVVGSSGSDHMAGLKLFLIDPVLKRELIEKGYEVAVTYYTDLSEDILKQFNVVILVQEAVLNNKEPHFFEVYKSKLPLLQKYVDNGGGLMVFFDERHYAKEWDFSINYCLKMFGASVADEACIESNPANVHEFEMVPGQGAFKTTNISSHPITEDIKELWYPRMTRVINVSDNWQVIVHGEQTAKTEKTYPSAPAIVAVAQHGKGRVALFAGLSSFYVLNGYHRTYENGWLFNQGDGVLFFDNLYNWLSLPSMDAEDWGSYDGKELSKPSVQLGTKIEKIIQNDSVVPLSGLIGIYTTYSGGQYTVADFAEKAKLLGLKYIAMTDKIINENDWNKLVLDCKNASDEDFVAIPGVEFTTSWHGNEQGLQGFMINGDKWPPIYGDSFISTELRTSEQHNSLVVVANPKSNSLKPWNVGGFHSLEIMSYQGSEQFSAALDWYRWYQSMPSVGWYPVVSHRIWNLSQLEDAKEYGYSNYIYAKNVEQIRDVPGEGLTPGFVSNGPVISEFRTDVIMRDPWEYYYLWTPGKLCNINISVESESQLESIILYSGSRIVRKFYPSDKEFKKKVSVPLSQEGSFYLEVVDSEKRNAYSYTIPTRNLNYWNHIGSDAMNDYHNPVNEDPLGDLLYEGKKYGYGGLVTFGYGWGNYIRYYHPVAVNEFHPLGYESGTIPAGLANIQTYPTVWFGNRKVHKGFELDNALSRRTSTLASADVAVICETVDFINDNGRSFESEHINSRATSTLYRYEYKPYGYIIMPVETEMTVKTTEGQTLNLLKKDGLEVALLTLTFQSNKDLNAVSWIDTDGQFRSEAVDFSESKTVKMFKVDGGSFITLSPDPFGQVGLFVTEGSYDVEIVGGDKPVIRIGYDMDNGQLNNGQKFDGHFIVMQEGGGQGINVCRELYDSWGLDGSCAYKPKMISGVLEKAMYTVDMKSDAGVYGVIVKFDEINELANNLLPSTISGVNHNWTTAAISPKGYCPTGSEKNKMYIGLRMPVSGEYFIGNPIVVDNDDLVVEIVKYGKTVEVNIHNPTDSKIVSTVKANGLLADKLALSKKVILAAGETVKITGKIN